MDEAALIVFGLIVGSFLNVVVARLPHGRSLWKPGSHCPSCQAPIRWRDNVPLLSWIFLRGRCQSCRAAISVRYPVIEATTALLFVAFGHMQGGLFPEGAFNFELVFRDLPFCASLIAVTFIDLEHRIIPDEISVGGLAFGLATSFIGYPGWVQAFIGAAVGFCIFYFFAWAYERFSGRMGLGGGDIKLLAMLGAFLGLQGVFFTILVSSVLGTAIGITWALVMRKKDLMTVAIPYGPFLVVGALTYRLLGERLLHVISNL
jgi:leader peptidase (prepilin peptidase)/N-methyltransferase